MSKTDESDWAAKWANVQLYGGCAAPPSGAMFRPRAFTAWWEQQSHEPFSLQRLAPIELAGYIQQLQRESATSTVNVYFCSLRSLCSGWSSRYISKEDRPID